MRYACGPDAALEVTTERTMRFPPVQGWGMLGNYNASESREALSTNDTTQLTLPQTNLKPSKSNCQKATVALKKGAMAASSWDLISTDFRLRP